MASSMSEAALKLEIARLEGAIDRHKSEASRPHRRSNTYINPDYKPFSKNIRSVPATSRPHPLPSTLRDAAIPQTREVVIGGVTFESSGRSLVRKDLPKPASSAHLRPASSRPRADFASAKTARLPPKARVYMPKTSRGRRGRSLNRNLTLNSRHYQPKRTLKKYSDKPCPRFTTTGACSHGLTCIYQHDPTKIAICWNFLQGNCPDTAETCNLSHDPTPERTPLCMHFANNGRCNRENCPFPHVHVGTRHGVCRDFAVLGFCAKGLDCDKQHVRECPDFAEQGCCVTKGCKLPHVIRANRNRKPAKIQTNDPSNPVAPASSIGSSKTSTGTDDDWSSQRRSASDAQLGDEYISLTFHESESSDEEDHSPAEESASDEELDHNDTG